MHLLYSTGVMPCGYLHHILHLALSIIPYYSIFDALHFAGTYLSFETNLIIREN